MMIEGIKAIGEYALKKEGKHLDDPVDIIVENPASSPAYKHILANCKAEYVAARENMRDAYCKSGCFWRHEISASMLPENAGWSKKEMFERKKHNDR